jgi:hypothetical protein
MEQATTDINSGMLASEQRGNFSSYTVNEDDSRIKSIEEQINKQEVCDMSLNTQLRAA